MVTIDPQRNPLVLNRLNKALAAAALATLTLGGLCTSAASADSVVDCGDPAGTTAMIAAARAESHAARAVFQELVKHPQLSLKAAMVDARQVTRAARENLAAIRHAGQAPMTDDESQAYAAEVAAARQAVRDAVAGLKDARHDLAHPKQAQRQAKAAWDEAKATWHELKSAAEACDPPTDPPTDPSTDPVDPPENPAPAL